VSSSGGAERLHAFLYLLSQSPGSYGNRSGRSWVLWIYSVFTWLAAASQNTIKEMDDVKSSNQTNSAFSYHGTDHAATDYISIIAVCP